MITPNLAFAGKIMAILGGINFVVFFGVAIYIGGDALNGHVEGGRFFLSSHGKLTETSESIFLYSQLHALSIFITHPLAIIGGWINHKWKKQDESAQPHNPADA
jgi:hypothetical protein